MNITETFPYFSFLTTTDTVGSNPEAAVGSECSTGSTTCPTDVVQELETLQPKAIPQPLKQKECTQPEEEKKLVEELLKETETSLLHHKLACPAVSCQKISADDQKAEKSLKDKFKHKWLTDKSLAYCSKTEIWWLAYVEGKGMYCLLCRKHNTKNEQNKSKVISSDPAVRYRKPTITSHADSRQNHAAIEAEHLQRVSTLHKESVNRENVADDVLYKALMSVYWIAKHEIPIRKLVPLLQLLEKVAVTEMKYVTHRSAGSVRELFLTLGQIILEQLLEKVHRSNFVGLLCDNVTDIATLEQFISFTQFVDPNSGEVCTDFLFVENALANSKSADAQTLFTILTSKLQELKITTEKCSSFVSDGANVMLGVRSGLATRLKELYPTLISVHCICHKLALACADTSKDLDYIAGVERDVRTLWKAIENSPKRTNMYLSVQEELKSLRLQDQSKKIVARRLKKACHTRWLSMGQALDTVYRDLEAVLRTGYGDDHIKSLSKNFFAERVTEENDQANVNAEKLKAEWGKFKIDLIDWKDELPRDIKEGKAATTSTTWTLHRMTRQPSFCHFFPLLFSLAERCLSIPVSNAWPERGASALERVKPRLRNRLKNDMLQALLQVSINGPAAESDACANIIQSAVDAWNSAKKRRNIPQSRGMASTPAAVTQVQVAQVQVADAAVQADDNEQMETIKAEVQAATTALKLTEDRFEDDDNADDSDYDSDFDFEY